MISKSKNSLSSAYSSMKNAGHKMSDKENCSACGGAPCKYADGGSVKGPGGVDVSKDKGKAISDSFKSSGSSFFGMPSAQADTPPQNKSKGGLIKGVHRSSMGVDKPMDKKEKKWAGESMAGQDARNSDINDSSIMHSKEEHHKVLGELSSMKKPDLKGLAKGGEVSGFDLNDQAVANWMAEGKHTMADGGEVDNDLMEHCAHELMEAFETKNKQGLLDSLRAIILNLKG